MTIPRRGYLLKWQINMFLLGRRMKHFLINLKANSESSKTPTVTLQIPLTAKKIQGGALLLRIVRRNLRILKRGSRIIWIIRDLVWQAWSAMKSSK